MGGRAVQVSRGPRSAKTLGQGGGLRISGKPLVSLECSYASPMFPEFFQMSDAHKQRILWTT